MKRYLGIALFLISPHLLISTFKTSQTFMFFRPLSHNAAAIEQGWGQLIAHKGRLHHAAGQLVSLYQQSTLNIGAAKYFLIDCKKEILVTGDDSPYAALRDVRAEWLNLPSNFSGKLAIKPKQQQAGGIICFNQDIGTYIPCKFFEAWWLELRLPLYLVKNNLCLQQSNIENPGTNALEPHDLIQAMAQFPFAAMDHKTRTSGGLANVSLALGATFLNQDDFILTSHVALSIPTCKKQQSEYIFTPYLENNGHLGMRYSLYFEMPLHEITSSIKSIFFMAIDDYYYYKNHQMRTFDLFHKQWSRYLPLRNINTGQIVSGVTVLTQRVCVKPHNFVDLISGLKFRRNNWELEAGYDLWAHHSEKIQLTCKCCSKTQSLIREFGIAAPGGGTANQSTIKTLATTDLLPTGLFVNDIDEWSASGRSGYTNKFHIACAYHRESEIFSLIFGIGGYFEKPSTNTALEQWGAWFKCIGEF